jgi:hypothetical protein
MPRPARGVPRGAGFRWWVLGGFLAYISHSGS